jgi:hypothetical protein
LSANKEIPEDLVDRIVKAVVDKGAQSVKARSAAGETIPAKSVEIPFCRFIPGRYATIGEIEVDAPTLLVD